jgi:hypothetical protein
VPAIGQSYTMTAIKIITVKMFAKGWKKIRSSQVAMQRVLHGISGTSHERVVSHLSNLVVALMTCRCTGLRMSRKPSKFELIPAFHFADGGATKITVDPWSLDRPKNEQTRIPYGFGLS